MHRSSRMQTHHLNLNNQSVAKRCIQACRYLGDRVNKSATGVGMTYSGVETVQERKTQAAQNSLNISVSEERRPGIEPTSQWLPTGQSPVLPANSNARKNLILFFYPTVTFPKRTSSFSDVWLEELTQNTGHLGQFSQVWYLRICKRTPSAYASEQSQILLVLSFVKPLSHERIWQWETWILCRDPCVHPKNLHVFRCNGNKCTEVGKVVLIPFLLLLLLVMSQ